MFGKCNSLLGQLSDVPITVLFWVGKTIIKLIARAMAKKVNILRGDFGITLEFTNAVSVTLYGEKMATCVVMNKQKCHAFVLGTTPASILPFSSKVEIVAATLNAP